MVICRARNALQAHSVVAAVGSRSTIAQLGSVLGIHLPQASLSQSMTTTKQRLNPQKPASGPAAVGPQSSATQVGSDAQVVFLGAHIDAHGVMQTYEGLAAQGGETRAAEQFNQWVSAQQAATQQSASPQSGA